MKINFDNTYSQLPENFFARVNPVPVKNPQLIYFNHSLADELGLDQALALDKNLAAYFSGNIIPEGAEPIAMAYAGHQFGHFVPQLGDGRALLLGEVVAPHGKRYDIHLKGSGQTPFSRRGDGRAALGPVLRELIVSEAMHNLGVPTSRTLLILSTGETVQRDEPEPGAILVRVAASHIRIGTFEYFAARRDIEALGRLADYAIARHYPHLTKGGKTQAERHLGFLESVVDAQASLMAKWMGIGFIHGVMNTDNMTVSGETIDYGPCAFIDNYESMKVYSSIDHHGRYAFGNQPAIARWNLTRLAETLLPLIDSNPERAITQAQSILETFDLRFKNFWLKTMRQKLGLALEIDDDQKLIEDLLEIFEKNKADFTNSFANLENVMTTLSPEWLQRWRARRSLEPHQIPLLNPYFIPRNHRIAEVIKAATEQDDFSKLMSLMGALAKPFEFSEDFRHYALPPEPHEVVHQTFCGT